MDSTIIAIQVLLPLISGLICFLSPSRYAWLLTCIATIINFVIAILIFKLALKGQIISYHFGGWSSYIGIEYKLDPLGAFFILLASFTSLISILATRNIITREIPHEKLPLFLGIFLIALAGFLGLCLSNDIFHIYVMLEVSSIASYALVSSGKSLKSAKAGFDYLIFGTIGSTMILFGIGFIYALTGTLNLSYIAQDMPSLLNNKAAIAGMFLIIFGILMKAALFPLSKWLVDIYQGAPSSISALLASTSNKIAIYLLIRFYFNIFKINNHNFEYLNITLLICSIFAIFTCSILAYRQTDLKRFLAYSSLSQIGFIIFAIAIANKFSLSGLLIYCFTHAMEKVALFIAAGYLVVENMENLANLVKKNLLISVIIIINLLSNMGFPLTAGFVGKWQLLKAALQTDLWYILILLTATLFSFFYVFKFIELITFKKEETSLTLKQDKTCLFVLSLITFINILIGINSNYILNIANKVLVFI